VLFSIIKYLGAAYLIYIGWKTFQTKKQDRVIETQEKATLSNFTAFKVGFITNALNPKPTIFFLSIFTQVVNADTPILLQLLYGAIISLAHLLWFSFVVICLTQPALLKRFNEYKTAIEKVVGVVLMGFGLKVATTSSP
jgi:threonine/homoserine/homoserine lactone efflux protein